MPIGSIIGGALSLFGSSSSASSQQAAAEAQAKAQVEAARIAAEEARFRPVGVTTRFGKSNFDFGIPGVSAPTIDQFKTREQQLADAMKTYTPSGSGGWTDWAYGNAASGAPTLDQFKTPEEQLAAATADYQSRLTSEGRLSGAGYELSPELLAQQDRLIALSNLGLTDAEGAAARYAPLREAGQSLFDLGSKYLSESPEDVAAKYMAQQQSLLAPTRERQYAGLQNQLFNTGRAGLAVGATGTRPDGTAGLGAANPEMEAYYNALAQQDLGLASEAQKRGQENLAFGTTLYNTGAGLLGGYDTGVTGALSPFSAYLGGATGLETLGQQPLEMGAALGGRAATAGGTAGNYLMAGGMGAANARASTAGLNPTADFISGLGGNKDLTGYLSGLFGGGSRGTNATGYGWGGGTDFSVLPSSWG